MDVAAEQLEVGRDLHHDGRVELLGCAPTRWVCTADTSVCLAERIELGRAVPSPHYKSNRRHSNDDYKYPAGRTPGKGWAEARERFADCRQLAVGVTASGIVGGLATAGDRPLVGHNDHLLGPGQAAVAVLLAWASVLAPTLAFAAAGLLGSVTLGRSPIGLVIPALLALLAQVVQVLPLPLVVRFALPSNAFIAWRGLFTEPTRPVCL